VLRLAVLPRLPNRLSLLPNRHLRLRLVLRLLPVAPKPAALRLLLSKPKRPPSVLPKLLVKLAKPLLRLLRLNACKCNFKTHLLKRMY
jgi:hypothetical protein